MATYQIDLDLLLESKKTYKKAMIELQDNINESKKAILCVNPEVYAGKDADALRELFSEHIEGYFTDTKEMVKKVWNKLTVAYITGQLCKKKCYDLIKCFGKSENEKSMESFGGKLFCNQEIIIALKLWGSAVIEYKNNVTDKVGKAVDILGKLQMVTLSSETYVSRIKAGGELVEQVEDYSLKLTEYASFVETMDDHLQKNMCECLPDDYVMTADGVDERQFYLDIECDVSELEGLMKLPEQQLSPEERAKKDVMLQKFFSIAYNKDIYTLLNGMSITKEDIYYKLWSTSFMQVIQSVAAWYVENIHTYCTLTTGGSPKVHGRAYYQCNMDGYLSNIKVGDDCSSFLWACLVQEGYFNERTPIYSSRDYLPGGAAEKKMSEEGFVWYSFAEIDGEDLKEGDILVRNGHVEIFSHYDEKGREYAYTWGAIYEEEPARKATTIDDINSIYTGIWRLEI